MLRRAIQFDHWQMPLLLMKADDHLKPLARFPGNECLGLGAGRTTWPALARFDSWFAIGGIAIVIDLLGRLAAERRMRAIPGQAL